MSANRVPLFAIQGAVHDVMRALTQDAVSPPRWTDLPEDALWRELVACILGSRVRFSTAHAAIERLANAGLLSAPTRSMRFNVYEKALAEILSTSPAQHPFSRVKAQQIRGAAEYVYTPGQSLHRFLGASREARAIRRELANGVPGIGPKQASLFLRNIGFASNLAVLDVHVLTYMNWFQLTEQTILSVPNIGRYETVEEAFVRHSQSLGHSPDRFDVAVWVVVRTARMEFANGFGDACVGRI